MEFDFDRMDPRDRYKLLTAVVVPRPIALTVSLDEDGRVNAAPFSFFNLMGNDPPVVVLGPSDRARDDPKDTPRNIRLTGEYVINIVDEVLAERMNLCAVDFPPGTNELEMAGLTTSPSIKVKPPRIAESPVSLECRHAGTLEIGRTRVIAGEVVHLRIRDDLVDAEKFYVATERLGAIGRMHGTGWYARTTDLFLMPRISYEEWLERKTG